MMIHFLYILEMIGLVMAYLSTYDDDTFYLQRAESGFIARLIALAASFCVLPFID